MAPLLLSLTIAALVPLGSSQTTAPLPTTEVPPRLPLQLTSLAAATCLEAGGQLRPDQRALLLQLQGRYWGWPRFWEQSIDPRRVVALIQRQGGCTNLLQALRSARIQRPRPALQLPGSQLPGLPRTGSPPRSEMEGFGLAPYR